MNCQSRCIDVFLTVPTTGEVVCVPCKKEERFLERRCFQEDEGSMTLKETGRGTRSSAG